MCLPEEMHGVKYTRIKQCAIGDVNSMHSSTQNQNCIFRRTCNALYPYRSLWCELQSLGNIGR